MTQGQAAIARDNLFDFQHNNCMLSALIIIASMRRF